LKYSYIFIGFSITLIFSYILYWISTLTFMAFTEKDIWTVLGGGFLILLIGTILINAIGFGLLLMWEGIKKRSYLF